jgi:hypothetical protein
VRSGTGNKITQSARASHSRPNRGRVEKTMAQLYANTEECEHGVPAGEQCAECIENAECEDMFGDDEDLLDVDGS